LLSLRIYGDLVVLKSIKFTLIPDCYHDKITESCFSLIKNYLSTKIFLRRFIWRLGVC